MKRVIIVSDFFNCDALIYESRIEKFLIEVKESWMKYKNKYSPGDYEWERIQDDFLTVHIC